MLLQEMVIWLFDVFFKWGKQACFKVVKQYDEFITAFRLLGEDWELNAELIVALENFVCHLYRYNHPDINKVRQKIFVKKFVKEEKVMVLSLLPLFQFRKSWLMKILMKEASNLNYILKTTIMMKTLMTNITIPFSSYVIFTNH